MIRFVAIFATFLLGATTIPVAHVHAALSESKMRKTRQTMNKLKLEYTKYLTCSRTWGRRATSLFILCGPRDWMGRVRC